jgi:predicted Zn-dependent peptidase
VAIQNILLSLAHDPESYRSEFVLARRETYEQLLAGTTSVAEMSNRLVHMARFNLADDYYERLAARVANLTLRDIQRLFAHDLTASKQVFGAFGPRASAEKALHAAAARLAQGWHRDLARSRTR